MDVVLIILALVIGAGLGALGLAIFTAKHPESAPLTRADEEARRAQLAAVGVTTQAPTVRAHERCSCTHERTCHFGGGMDGACSVAFCTCARFEHA